MELSSRVKGMSESVTLKLNTKAMELAENGKQVYNLTAGQLPFRPPQDFVESIRAELDFLRSYQYSPVSGYIDLRKKILTYLKDNDKLNKDNEINNIKFKLNDIDKFISAYCFVI